MGAVVEVIIVCDNPKGCPLAEPFGVDNSERTIREQRREAKENGWTYSKGKDYCPVCSSEMRHQKS
jgi:hypothetical protein